MPVRESLLIRRMKEDYRGGGYYCGLIRADGAERLMLHGGRWAAAMPYSEAGRELRAAIVRHTGELPGRPALVRKDAVQLQMAGELERTYAELFRRTPDMQPCWETGLYLGERAIWQDRSGRCSLFEDSAAGLLAPMDGVPLERETDGRRLLMTDGESRLLAWAGDVPPGKQELLDYLSRHDWTEGGAADAGAGA